MAKRQTRKQSPARPAPARARPRGSRQKALLAASVLVAKKAERVTVLDLRKLTLIADYFAICHGRSEAHVRALAKELGEQLAAHGVKTLAVQGLPEGRWVLLDLGDVIVHIFAEFERGFYALERLWGDAPLLDVS